METLIIDANIAVALVCPLPYSHACRDKMEQWVRSGVEIAVPALWDYEITSALRKQWAQGLFSREAAIAGLELIFRLPVQRISLDSDLSIAALRWAEHLGQRVAYDAQYLALAERVGAPFFTSDRKLYIHCKEIGVNFINLLA